MTLVEAVQATIRRLHCSPHTEAAYFHWIRELIRFHEGRHPRVLGAVETTALLDHLAVERRIAAATQNQTLCAILFLDKRVLALDLPLLEGLEHAQRPAHLLAVLGRRDAFAVLDRVAPRVRLIGEILSGCGVRLLKSLAWQYLVPASRPWTDPVTGRLVLEGGTNLRTIQPLLGHKDLRTTRIDTPIVDRGPLGGVSPQGR